jgi:hypothetical protein
MYRAKVAMSKFMPGGGEGRRVGTSNFCEYDFNGSMMLGTVLLAASPQGHLGKD